MKRFYLLPLLFVPHIVWCLSYHHLQLGQKPFDHLQLVQRWPNTFCTTSAPGPKPRPVNCKTIPQNFTLRGLWPANGTGYSLIDDTPCNTNLSDVFKNLTVCLHKYWPSITTWPNESFWKEEWCKHGRCSLSNSTCASGAADINIPSNSNSNSNSNKHGICSLPNFQVFSQHPYWYWYISSSNPPTTDIPIFITPLDYFRFTIHQIKKVGNLLIYLEAKGIKPDNKTLYSKLQIVQALQPLIGDQNNVSVSCRSRNTTRDTKEFLLFEIYICLRINYISCPRPNLPRGCNSKDGKFKLPPFSRRISV